MVKWIKVWLFGFLVLGMFTCIKPIAVELPELDEGIAVSAYLSTQKGLQSVKITRLAPFTTAGLNYPIKDATVWIVDDSGARQNFAENAQKAGLYLPSDPDFAGEAGKTYVLHILTKDQIKYESTPQNIRPVPPVKKVYREEIIADVTSIGPAVVGFKILLDIDDPATEGDYYRWNWTNYETVAYCQVFVEYKEMAEHSRTLGIGCCQACWDINPCYNNCVNIRSDAFFNGKTIIRQPITRIPYCAEDYYIEVQQRSISKEAFDYWTIVDQLSTNNGSIFDTPPAKINGNLKCISDPDLPIYGLFEVSDLAEDGFFISRTDTSVRGVYTCPQKPEPLVTFDCAPCVESQYRTRTKPRFWTK